MRPTTAGTAHRAIRIEFLGMLVAVLAITLSACMAGPAVSIDGTSWRAVAIGGETPVPGREPTLTFAGGKVQGSGGCNGFGGTYRLDGDRITFTEMAMTAMGCLGPEGPMEATFSQLMGQVERLSVTGDRLSLVGPAGSIEFAALGIEG